MSIKSTGRGSDSIISAYFADLSREPQMSFEEQINFIPLAQKGDKSALKKLVTANLALVIAIAKNFQHRGLELCDLIAEGNLGLFDAIRKYDINAGFKFSSYASSWIKMHIIIAIEENNAIRIPHKAVAVRKDFIPCHLEDFLTVDKNLTLGEILVDNLYPSVEDEIMEMEMKKSVVELFNGLSEKEISVVKKYFGFGVNKKSFKIIGDEMNLSKESTRLIQIKAIKKMKPEAEKKSLSDFIQTIA